MTECQTCTKLAQEVKRLNQIIATAQIECKQQATAGKNLMQPGTARGKWSYGKGLFAAAQAVYLVLRGL